MNSRSTNAIDAGLIISHGSVLVALVLVIVAQQRFFQGEKERDLQKRPSCSALMRSRPGEQF
jgi:hypothetical protein